MVIDRLTFQLSPKRLIVGGIVAFFFSTAIYTSTLIVRQQAALQEVSRYNVTWMVSQAALGIARLTAVAAASGLPGSDIDQDEVRLRLDIVINQTNLLTTGETGQFVRSDPELNDSAQEIQAVVQAVRKLVDQPQSADSAQAVAAMLLPLNAKLPKLASVAYLKNGDLVGKHLSQLNQLHWVLSFILLVLIAGSFCLIALLMRHNHLLDRAHRRVQDLVASLRKTSFELQEANSQAEQAMADVDQRNHVLQERDHTLFTQNQRFDAALNNMSQALCMVDMKQRLIVCNRGFRQMFELDEQWFSPGTPVGDIFSEIGRVTDYNASIIHEIWADQQILAKGRASGAFFKEASNGLALAVSQQPMSDGGWVATYEDITERRRADSRIHFLAHHDALTRLPNRLLFRRRLDAAISELKYPGEGFALLCLDLDRFKNVNDTLGHPAGDALLQAVAERLRACVRDTDIVSRFSGDEFSILQVSGAQPADAEALARRLVTELSLPFDLAGRPAIVTASVGIIVVSDPASNADVLLKNADVALYRAKADGGATYRFFEAQMDEENQARREMELDLREALVSDQFEIFYQPVFDLRVNRVTAFEALLRWRHPHRGVVSPSEFIGVAEELELIIDIGEWVLSRACQDAATFPTGISVAVNLSTVQFRKGNLISTVQNALAAARLPPSQLELEITETALLQHNEAVISTMHTLRDLGVRTSLDDFGTGYSSLSYLRSFPFDKIKIDQSFVREMNDRPDCLAIVKSVASLGHALGMATTAEGVETVEQLVQLRLAGCTQAQGFYFAKPEPLRNIGRWFGGDIQELPEIQPSVTHP